MAQTHRKAKPPAPPRLRTKTSVAVNPALWERLRIQALREHRTVYALLEEAMDRYLTQVAKDPRWPSEPGTVAVATIKRLVAQKRKGGR